MSGGHELVLRAPVVADPAGFNLLREHDLHVSAGRLRAILPHGEASGAAIMRVFDDAVILPAFVNAHAHLDLSHLRDKGLRGDNFDKWLRSVMESRRAPWTEVRPALEGAVREAFETGTSRIVDILAPTALAIDVAKCVLKSPLRATFAIEALSGDPAEAPGELNRALAIGWQVKREIIRASMEDDDLYDSRQRSGPRNPAAGISPHAPYTVSPELYTACGRAALDLGMLQTTHLAESPAERQFLLDGGGEFRALFESLGLDLSAFRAPGVSPLDYWLDTAGRFDTPGVNDTIFAHCYDLSLDEIARMGAMGASVAWCPRSRAYFGHPRPDFRRFIDAGVNVCIGTDSLGSTPNLVMSEELAQARTDCPDIAPAELFRCATINGRKALLGRRASAQADALTWADFQIVALPKGWNGESDLYAALIDERPPVLAVIVDGEVVWERA